MDFVVAAPKQASIPVQGIDAHFPVRRVYCVGRNYAAHSREMGYDPERETPFFFNKPADAIRPGQPGQVLEIPYPPKTENLHYEVELVVALAKGGKNIPVADALSHVYGYAVGLDLTRRDRQQDMKDQRRPWELGKAFDASGPISVIQPADQAGDVEHTTISLAVNGEQRQNSNTDHMIWSIAESISFLSEYFELQPGDLLFTGTPEGVGPVVVGDTLEAQVAGVAELSVKMV